ncbi:hypothetical protein JL722_11265 [Aureococcus anophagefferens]|nr:hypothetical protein JL722_11265 [Aureococcus anophagefferens]
MEKVADSAEWDDGPTFGATNPMCVLLVSITCEFIEGPATIVAPGFQPHVNDGTLRRKWARHVAADAAAAALLSLIVWIMWVKFNGLRVYRIYWEGRRVRRWVLVFAMLAKVALPRPESVTLIFCSCFITYMLFRGDNALLSMILNVMKIQYVNRLDTEVVRIGREAPRLGCVIGDAEDLTASVARDLRKRDLPKTLTKIESASFATIRKLARVRLSQAILECVFRVCRLAFRICAFALLLTCATGGHIAHIHFRNVLWFLTLLKQRYRRSSEYLHVFIVDSPKTDAVARALSLRRERSATTTRESPEALDLELAPARRARAPTLDAMDDC